jgi:hypothetical protein
MAQRTPDGAVVSCFGDISVACAAALGARVAIALPLGARTAEARAVRAAARDPRHASARDVLPTALASPRVLPTSRVQVSGAADRVRATGNPASHQRRL